MTRTLDAIVAQAEGLSNDFSLASVRAWKDEHPGAKAIGYLPVFAPIELITAAGMHPVGIIGGGDQIEIIRGDAYFQSYICHLPRSIIELGVSGRLDACDGFLFPSTCDVIRNLSGIWKLLFPDKYARYVDVPQDFSPGIGGRPRPAPALPLFGDSVRAAVSMLPDFLRKEAKPLSSSCIM